MPRYGMDTARTRHGYNRGMNFLLRNIRSDMLQNDMLPILKNLGMIDLGDTIGMVIPFPFSVLFSLSGSVLWYHSLF